MEEVLELSVDELEVDITLSVCEVELDVLCETEEVFDDV